MASEAKFKQRDPWTVSIWTGKPMDPEDRSEASITWKLLETDEPRPCVIVFPGGGYRMLASHEAEPVSDWLNAHGYHSAVLRYSLAPAHRHPAMINDAQRSVRLVRSQAEQHGIRPDAIGVLGFSAGGHLASTAAVHYDRFPAEKDDLVGTVSARPDAAVLCYAVIDFESEAAHTGSHHSLLGEDADPQLIRLMSANTQVTPETPPTFLWHTREDKGVPYANSELFAAACEKHGVPYDLRLYQEGGHGLGLADGSGGHGVVPEAGQWRDACIAFLDQHLLSQTAV